MTELLAPAGNFEALVAASSNGCDAIYLGMSKFGARAYANNFNEEEFLQAIEYAHLRNVRVYVTMNTIVYDNELNDAYKQLDFLYKANVDGVIVQDLALFSYIVKNYPKMEAHTSTQMGIDDLEGTLLFKELGAKRVVLSREVPIEKIKEIKTKSMVKAFSDLKVSGKTLVILPEKNINVQASTNNIKDAKVILVNEINIYDLLKYTNLVLPLDSVKKIEEVYA